MDDLIGRVFGQYEITALLGVGGMATVYRARQISMGRDVAIKGYSVWQTIAPQENAPVSWKRAIFDLPKRAVHKDFAKIGGAEYAILDKALDVMLVALYPTSTQTLSVRLGELQIVGVPGEMISELGMEIKHQDWLDDIGFYRLIGPQLRRYNSK